MSKLLKPCPFCGEKVKFIEYPEMIDVHSASLQIKCCFITSDLMRWGNGYLSKPKAEKQLAALWNLRF